MRAEGLVNMDGAFCYRVKTGDVVHFSCSGPSISYHVTLSFLGV